MKYHVFQQCFTLTTNFSCSLYIKVSVNNYNIIIHTFFFSCSLLLTIQQNTKGILLHDVSLLSCFLYLFRHRFCRTKKEPCADFMAMAPMHTVRSINCIENPISVIKLHKMNEVNYTKPQNY
jgi:hypothetical protein